MPIPDFDHNLVLPPHTGNHAEGREHMSPYPCTSLELCSKLGRTPERQTILRGFFELRDVLRRYGVTGFQWMDGSFTENVEENKKRPKSPGDIDIVTFFHPPASWPSPIPADLKILNSRNDTKARFHVDHILIPLNSAPERLIDETRYWFGLFSHRREDDVWKGMLQLSLDTAAEDALAIGTLTGGTP